MDPSSFIFQTPVLKVPLARLPALFPQAGRYGTAHTALDCRYPTNTLGCIMYSGSCCLSSRGKRSLLKSNCLPAGMWERASGSRI